MSDTPAAKFYEAAYQSAGYADFTQPADHFALAELTGFLEGNQLREAKCLEIGCGRGAFQDLVPDYTGVDLSPTAGGHLRKPFVCSDATRLPFADHTFDAAWSITVLEHVPDPQAALEEMRRVLKPGGFLFLKPAWHCRPWICEGLPVRPYRDLSLRQRWIKATIPLRNSYLLRLPRLAMARVAAWLSMVTVGGPRRLRFRRLPADYTTFWMVDSDAVAALDPFDVILWFRARGDTVLSHPTLRSAVLSRHEPVVVRVEHQKGHG
jgi:SAM-dependent methyltransferase